VAALAHVATSLSDYLATRGGPAGAANGWDTVAGFFAGLAASHARHGGETKTTAQAVEEVMNQVYTIDYNALGVVVPESVRANLHRSASAVEQHVLRRSRENPLDPDEVELLQGLVAGRSISDLAADFGYSERSISRSLRSIWDRVGAVSRSEGIAMITANGWLHARGAGGTSPLSADDRRLLQLLVSGRTVEEIANYLDVSTRTIHRRLQHIWDEIGATSRSEGIAIVSTRGWLEAQPSTTSE
jgi:DNA-binding NarL/FixJ family response regulator